MKAILYYQDIKLNAFSFGNKQLKIKIDEAVLIREFSFEETVSLFDEPTDEISKEWMCDALWSIMNRYPDKIVDGEAFVRAGHTSMSVGDYLVFDDGDIRIAAFAGWVETTVKEISQPKKKV